MTQKGDSELEDAKNKLKALEVKLAAVQDENQVTVYLLRS